MRPDICCIGLLTIDRIITPQTTAELPGGTAFYFCRALRGINVRVHLLTATAPADAHLAGELRTANIDVTCLPAAQTLLFENRYGDDADQRTQRVLQTAPPFPLDAFSGLAARVFHLGPLTAGDIPDAAMPLLATKGALSLDVQGLLRRVEGETVLPVDWPRKKAILPLVHYLKASEEEAQVLTGTADGYEAAKQLAAWGAKEVIITFGSKGSLVYDGNEFHRIRAFAPTHAVDATGCGDTYMAGYLAQRVRGLAVPDAGKFAAAMATMKLEHNGPFTGSEEDVHALVNASV